MTDIGSIQIASLSPAHQNFSLLFQLLSFISKDNQRLVCRIVDETGTVNACFQHYSDKLEEGVVYYMTNLICKVANNHLQVQMTDRTSITKQPAKLGFRDKANDISKKLYANRDEMPQFFESQNCSSAAGSGLIPLSQEEAQERIKQKKLFDQIMKLERQEKHKNRQRGKEKEKSKQKQAKEKITDKGKQEKQKHHHYKQKIIQTPKKNGADKKEDHENNKQRYKEKIIQNGHDGHKNLKYEKKHPRKEYLPKPQSPKRKGKSKSFMYKEKEQAANSQDTKQSPKKSEEGEYRRPKFVEKKQNMGQYMELISVVAHVGAHVNLRAWISGDKRKVTEDGYECKIADKTGSLWLQIMKLNLEGNQWYEIDNLEVVRQSGTLLLKQTELSEPRLLEERLMYNLKPISGK